ncbi:MAG: Flp family type IVb pilin [Polaromonas sp.]|nr:Flp family type IVb pilin [Polaromonas sp.]
MRGAVSIEYALVASLIALVIVVGFVVLGTSLGSLFAALAACFVTPASCLGGL